MDNFGYTFSTALFELKAGYKVARSSWGKEYWIKLQVPDRNSRMTLPYIYQETAEGTRVPWIPTQEDLLTVDWGIIYENV